MKILEVGSSLGLQVEYLVFYLKKLYMDTLSDRHEKSKKLNYDRNNIEFVIKDVYNQPWDFEEVDVVL